MPKDGAACSCSKFATTQQLSTKCYKPAGDGKCEGKRTCTISGLSACIAAPAGEEICDGMDNDCDGQIDEGTCDDKNTCTDNFCKGAAGCENPAKNGTCDADGSPCTEDACKEGLCVAGPAKCDDNNPCTIDACGTTGMCSNSNVADGVACGSGLGCKYGKCLSVGGHYCDTWCSVPPGTKPVDCCMSSCKKYASCCDPTGKKSTGLACTGSTCAACN